MTTIQFFVPGVPAPQGSKKAFRHAATGKIMLIESSKKLAPWRATVALHAKQAMKNKTMIKRGVPVHVNINFRMPRTKQTKSGRQAMPQKPDLDKLTRAVHDAITGICIEDDSQVIISTTCKFRASEYEETGAEITIMIDNDGQTMFEVQAA